MTHFAPARAHNYRGRDEVAHFVDLRPIINCFFQTSDALESVGELKGSIYNGRNKTCSQEIYSATRMVTRAVNHVIKLFPLGVLFRTD